MNSDGENDRRRRREPLLSDVTSSSCSSSSSGGGGDGGGGGGGEATRASDYLPPSARTSVSERIAASSSGAAGAPPSLPASMPQGTAGARRRARVSLRDYLEKNKAGEYSEEEEEEEPDLAEEDRKSRRRGRSRSRSRKSRRGGGNGGGRSVKSRGTKASYSSLRTDATGLISVREVRKAWGAMFFAAVMGSFVGTGGLHRLLNRGLNNHPSPPSSSGQPQGVTISKVPPPPSSGRVRGGKVPPLEPRAFDLDTEGYEDAMDMIAANNAAESRDRAAARARARSEIESKLPPELRMKNLRTIGVDEEAVRDMEILRGSIGGAEAKAEAAYAAETSGASEKQEEEGGVDLLKLEEQKLMNGVADEEENKHNTVKKEGPSAGSSQEVTFSPKFGVGVDDVDDKGLSEDEDDDDDHDKDKDDEDDDGNGEKGEKGKAGGYAPVSGKRPRRNGDGTIPDAAKP